MTVKNGGKKGKQQSPKFLTGVDTAERLGVTPKWLRELVKTGVLPREKGGYPWPAVRDAYHAHLESKRDEVSELRIERAALVRVQREAAELDLAERRGALVQISEVTEEYGRVLERLRARILNMPGKFAPRLVRKKLTTVRQVRVVLDDLARELIAELRSRYVDKGGKAPAG